MAEAFNSTIIIARGKPVVTMFEEIRVYLMERWEANRQKIARYEDEVLPNIKKRIARESTYINNWMVRYVISYSYCQLYVSAIMIIGWLICTLKLLV